MELYYETSRLILRVVTPDYAPKVLHFLTNDRELFEKYEGTHLPQYYSLSFQQENISCEYNQACKQTHIRFYIFRKEDPDNIIGTICFHNIQKIMYSSCEIGYKFASSHHHKGYATEAMEKAIQIAFEDMKLHRIMAWVIPENTASVRLLASQGFQFEGINRHRALLHGKWMDHAQYSLLSTL